MLINIDIPAESVAAFLALCAAQGIEIQDVDPCGPAGGNPCYTIAAHDRAALEALGAFYFG